MRIIAHIDMDAFFAAIEERDRPYLQGLPLVIGADPEGGKGRGVVSTANYLAREYGIQSALSIQKAWHFSETAKKAGKPGAIFLSGNYHYYSQISSTIMNILAKYGPIEVASVDEAYLDLSSLNSYKAAEKTAKEIKREIKKLENLTTSIGLGPNKMIAKIASGFKKPDGLTVISEEKVSSFLSPLSIRTIPGIGPKTEIILNKLRIQTIGDLQRLGKTELKDLLGKWGEELFSKVRGIDESPVLEEYPTKSIGEQITFDKDIKDYRKLFPILEEMVSRIWKSFLKEGFKEAARVVIIVRYADFETKTHSRTLKTPLQSSKAFYLQALSLLMPFLDKRRNTEAKRFRLIGLRLERLS